MKSRRDIENLSLVQIEQILKNKCEVNNVIINNASMETNNIKQRYGERLLSFFSILLAAAWLSSFVLYRDDLIWDNISVFFIVLDVAILILLIYSIMVLVKFFAQYNRQKIYRDVNNEISIILNHSSLFFNGSVESPFPLQASTETVSSLLHVIYKACKTKNKNEDIKKLPREWCGIIIAFVFLSLALIACTVLAILGKRIFVWR